MHAPAGEPALRKRIVAAYVRDGQVEDAVALAERAHAHAASLSTYDLLRTASQALGDWPERRQVALERLRGADPLGGHGSAVRAQLEDGDLDGAWADADEAGCDQRTWIELADASRERRPDDSIRVYRSILEQALEHADDHHYDRVVGLLVCWRETLELHGRAAELALEVARIRERYVRRIRLLARMDRAGLV